MNKILYSLIGLAVAGAIGASMFDPKIRRPLQFDEQAVATALVCLVVIAAGLLFLTKTPLGMHFTSSIAKWFQDGEDKARTTPGKVREPGDIWWWWWP